MAYLLCSQSNMQPENEALISAKRNSSFTESNNDSGIYRYLSLSSLPMQSNMTAPLSTIPESVELLPQSHFELSEQCDQTFLPAEDFQLGHLPLGCSSSIYPNLELLELDVLASTTWISNMLQNQQQRISEQQQHLNAACLEQKAYHYSSPEEGNQHQIPEKKSPLKVNTWLPGHGYKKMQCKGGTLCSVNYESILNNCQTATSCSTSEDLASAPIIRNHGMPMLPLDSPFPSSCTSTKLSRQEEISPNVFPQLSVHDPEMMINSLPEKGKLLEAVLKAGPLLKTLLLAGPLPLWQHPPPALDSFEIPLVPISPNPPLMNSLSSPPETTISFPNSYTGFTHKSPPQLTVYDKNLSFISQPSPYSPLPSSSPIGSSLKKRLMSVDDSLHNARSSFKHTKLH